MMKCKNCGKEMQDDMLFCPECGTPVVKEQPQTNRFCPFCGTKLEPGNNYCPVCGQNISKYNQGSNTQPNVSPENNRNVDGGYNSQPTNQDPNPTVGFNSQDNYHNPNSYGGDNNQAQNPGQYNNNYSQSYNSYGQTNSNQPNGYPAYGQPNNYAEPKKDPKIDYDRIENDKYKGYWRKPILWIVSVCLIVGAYFLVQYMTSNPISKDAYDSSKEVNIKITGENNSQTNMLNMQQEGESFLTDNTLYIVENNSLYKIDNVKDGVDYDKKEVVKSNVCAYITVVGKDIYYCDKSYDYYHYNTDDKKEEKLLENVYFVNKISDKLYYQKDGDKESIHVYDLKTKKDKALNNERSYNLYVDTTSGYIFYLGVKDDNYILKAMKLDGSNNIVLSNKSANYLLVNDKTIYYCTSSGIYKMDISNVKAGLEETKVVSKATNNINKYKDGFIYTLTGSAKVQYQSFDGKVKEEYFKNDYVTDLTVLGNTILVKNSDGQNYLVQDEEYVYLGAQSTDDSSSNDSDKSEKKDIDGETEF